MNHVHQVIVYYSIVCLNYMLECNLNNLTDLSLTRNTFKVTV